MLPTFEELRARIANLRPASDGRSREVYWARAGSLGIAVDRRGAVEIFLVEDRLVARSRLVARHLEFDSWLKSDGQEFIANRLVFPSAPHFLGFSALLVLELLTAGWHSSTSTPQVAFEKVEPLIEMALRRAGLSEEALLGLIGELVALEQLLIAVTPERVALRQSILDSWQGHQRSSRDFVLGDISIEIKTTMRPTSEHFVHSLSQIEVSGMAERKLYFLSIGLAPAIDGFSLPEIVDRLLALLGSDGASPLPARLLRDIAQYGGDGGLGYVHEAMRAWPMYQQGFLLSFSPRLYDMMDPNIRVVRRADLAGTFVNPEAIEYQMRLPPLISDVNPAQDWQQALTSLVREAS